MNDQSQPPAPAPSDPPAKFTNRPAALRPAALRQRLFSAAAAMVAFAPRIGRTFRPTRRRTASARASAEVAAAEAIPGKCAQPVVPRGAVGRNDPCPCGSGKKLKKCHGSRAVVPTPVASETPAPGA